MIKTKSVYAPAAPEDGFRLLVMRRWPRGVAKYKVDGWEKELGPSSSLLEDWQQKRLEWDQFAQRYEEEMTRKRDLLVELAQKAGTQIITLLCGCPVAELCHRTLLKRLIEEIPPTP